MSYNKKAVLAANTAAIGLLLRLEKEQRTATEEEQKVLRAYQGFGGLKCILNRTDQPEDIRYWAKSEQDLFAPTCALKQLIYREATSANKFHKELNIIPKLRVFKVLIGTFKMPSC